MESSSHEVLDDHSSDEGSLLLESLCNPAPCSLPRRPYCGASKVGETKNEVPGPKAEQQSTTGGRIYSPSCLSLQVYFSMLAVELNTKIESFVVVIDNAHIPLGDDYLLDHEDSCNVAFSRSLSAINTVSFPPPFLTMVRNNNDTRDVSSSRWDSIEMPRGGSTRRSRRPQLVNQTESTDLGPQLPGRTCDDYDDTEEDGQSIDTTMHHRFMERKLQSPVPVKKTQRRGRRRRPIVPCRTTTVKVRKPFNAPGPSSSLDSTSRWLRELPHRGGGDLKPPMPPCPRGFLVNSRRSRTSRRGDSVDELDDDISVTTTEDETRKHEPFRPDSTTSEEESWTVWFDMMASMASDRHDPGCDRSPIGDDAGLTRNAHQGITCKCHFEEESSDLKPTDSGVHIVASWDELTSIQRSSFWSSRRATNPSSLVNQLMIIDNGSPTNPFQRATQSPASHFKREQTKRKDIDLLLGHVSPSNPFERDTSSLSVSSHS